VSAFYDRLPLTRATPFKTELRLEYNWRWCYEHCLPIPARPAAQPGGATTQILDGGLRYA